MRTGSRTARVARPACIALVAMVAATAPRASVTASETRRADGRVANDTRRAPPPGTGIDAVPRPAGGTVHVDTLWSQSLGIRKALVVYLPPSYGTARARRYPLLVYLHGLGGNERNWSEQGRLVQSFDSLVAAGHPEAIVVMPDGDDGWYTTWGTLNDPGCRTDSTRREPASSYCVPWPHYDDYIARDVVAHVDARYRTVRSPRGRGIAGLSMGGYGAITLALAYPDVFGAAASHSGVLSPRLLGPKPYPMVGRSGAAPPARIVPRYARDTTELRQVSGALWRSMALAFGRDTIGWMARDPRRLATRLATRAASRRSAVRMPALLLDCGTADPYLDQNRDLHRTLTALGIAHRYAEWPGAHSWSYWRTHAPESLVFLLQQTAGSRGAAARGAPGWPSPLSGPGRRP